MLEFGCKEFMINQLGFYMTRDNRIVEITRILQSQPLAEGYVTLHGNRESFHVWGLNGYFDRQKETNRDIVSFVRPFSEEEFD
jgi:hypothetical protein